MSAHRASLHGDWGGWRVTSDQHWTRFVAPGSDLPDQGWKIHVSSCIGDASTVRRRTAAICRDEGWSFKHLRSEDLLQRANDKDAARSSSGKFVTIYPTAGLVTPPLLDRLTAALRGCRGPRILGDLQWRQSVLHLRYGAFRALHTWDGLRAVRRPDGSLEADRRGVAFDVPDWVELPGWMSSERAAQVDDAEMRRLEVTGAYSFSNAGGVYRAVHDEHGPIVLKEGREFVAERSGRDAADRVEAEHEMLRFLEGTDTAPKSFGSFRSAGSAFVMIERVPGVPFNRALMSRNPLTSSDPDRAALEAHATSVGGAIAALTGEIDRLHSTGVMHGDVSPRNVLVIAPGAVRLVDFESSGPDGFAADGAPATPGFSAPSTVRGPERDRFAIACLHLAALLPLTSLFPLDPGKIEELLDAAEEWFPTAPIQALRPVFDEWVPALEPDPARATLPSAEEIVAALDARSAPASVAGLEHGLDGRSLAIGRLGGFRSAATTVEDTRTADPGLLSGLASSVLLGSAAPSDLSRVRDSVLTTERVDLENGLAGIGLALLCGPGRSEHHETIHLIADRLVAFSDETERPQRLAPGLRNGPSGLALFLALHGRLNGEDRAVDAARRILDLDLRRLEHRAGSGLQLARDGRLVPFLASGSAGVGIALVQLFRAIRDDALLPTLEGIIDAATPVFTAHAGILDGRAGLVHFLVDAGAVDHPAFTSDDLSARLHEHRRRFSLHRLQTADGIRYPDHQLRDVDDGWGHGAAGVLSALAAIDEFDRRRGELHDVPSFLRGGPR
jgi:hypothetical protein